MKMDAQLAKARRAERSPSVAGNGPGWDRVTATAALESDQAAHCVAYSVAQSEDTTVVVKGRGTTSMAG